MLSPPCDPGMILSAYCIMSLRQSTTTVYEWRCMDEGNPYPHQYFFSYGTTFPPGYYHATVCSGGAVCIASIPPPPRSPRHKLDLLFSI
jgi:hypothetical protein